MLIFTVSIHSLYPNWLMSKDWLPLLGCFIVTGCLPIILGIMLILVGELFPSDIRTKSIGIVHGLEYFAFALATEAFPILLEWFQFYGLNLYYGAFGLLMTLWGMMTIKDVDQLSLEEIQKIYNTQIETSKASGD